MPDPTDDDRGFIATLAGDGRPLLVLTALALIASGAFAIFQAATGSFLPQDTDYLGMTARQLCALHECRVVHFMIHDRISFGGVLVAIGVMYLWLGEFPMRRREPWAWWALAISGFLGFLSFLAYLGYGYLDTWHGAATLVLLPLFGGGLLLTRDVARGRIEIPRIDLATRAGRGRALLLAATAGIVAAGVTISMVGMTAVFVPTDLQFIGATREQIAAINRHLVPLIAHDRAGFGGALVSCGAVMLLSVLFGKPSRSLWQALAIAGVAGFGTALGIHPVIGYTNAIHLAPAVAGCLVFAAGMLMTRGTQVTPGVAEE
jgi:hypothetical protein